MSGQFITSALRPGQRPTGAENAAIVQRVLKRLRAAWHETRCALALQHHPAEPSATRTDHDLEYAAQTWPKAFRGVLKAAVMALGDNPRFVITSLDLPSPEGLYRDLYCARGQDENWIKMIKNDRACDRTSDHRFLAHPLRLFFSCAADGLHHALRTKVLAPTELAQAQPFTVILKLFKIAVRVVPCQDRVKRHRPTRCPVKHVLLRVCGIRFETAEPVLNPS